MTTAIWEPETTPPDSWLLPAVLYQDRISTFAPLGGSPTLEDGEASRLEAVLGDVYRRFSVHQLDLWGLQSDHYFASTVENLAPYWHHQVKALAAKTGDPHLRLWVNRVSPAAKEARVASRDSLLREISQVRREIELLEGSTQQERAELEKRHREAVNAYDDAFEASRGARAELKSWRRERFEPFSSRREELIRLVRQLRRTRPGSVRDSRHLVASISQEIEELTEQLRAIAADEEIHVPPRPEIVTVSILKGEVSRLAEDILRLDSLGLVAKRRLADLEQRLKSLEDSPIVAAPGPLSSLVVAAMRSPHFDTLAFGKIPDGLFEALSTHAGLWILETNRRWFERYLVGPTLIIRDVLALVAERFCEMNPDWVTVTSDKGLLPLPNHVSQRQALAIQALLPAPQRGSLPDAVAFRRRHEEELAAVRRLLGARLAVSQATDLQDSISEMRHGLAEPLHEIRRALDADARLKLSWVKQSTVGAVRGNIKDAAGGILAGATASPFFGNTLDATGIAAGLTGGLMVSTTVIAGRLAGLWYERHRLSRRVEGGPLRYVYHLGQELGLAD